MFNGEWREGRAHLFVHRQLEAQQNVVIVQQLLTSTFERAHRLIREAVVPSVAPIDGPGWHSTFIVVCNDSAWKPPPTVVFVVVRLL